MAVGHPTDCRRGDAGTGEIPLSAARCDAARPCQAAVAGCLQSRRQADCNRVGRRVGSAVGCTIGRALAKRVGGRGQIAAPGTRSGRRGGRRRGDAARGDLGSIRRPPTALGDHRVRWQAHLWDTETGQEKAHWQADSESNGHVVAFSPDGETIVTGSFGGKQAAVWSWRGHEGTPQDAGSLRDASGFTHENGITSATFDDTGNLVVTTSWDKTARIWNLPRANWCSNFRKSLKALTGMMVPSARPPSAPMASSWSPHPAKRRASGASTAGAKQRAARPCRIRRRVAGRRYSAPCKATESKS